MDSPFLTDRHQMRSGVKLRGNDNFARRKGLKGRHRKRREGDEEACSCGKRWPFGEPHP